MKISNNTPPVLLSEILNRWIVCTDNPTDEGPTAAITFDAPAGTETKDPLQPRYIMTCITIAYILEFVAWHSLEAGCLSFASGWNGDYGVFGLPVWIGESSCSVF
jgi:hypothetical protein